MKKIKKLWNDNRVMFVLGIIVFLCVLIIMGVMLKYFFGTSKSSYGDRLDDISNIPFEDVDKEKIKEGFASENLLSISVDVKGKIIYVVAKFNGAVSLTEAQNKAIDVYNAMDEKYKKKYDFNVTVTQDPTEIDAYTLMGAKNVGSSNFIWSNNTPIEKSE